jgi:lipid II:glycine glycyltransferase (peptidoglycan interpeptide bridge formation enzyme)
MRRPEFSHAPVDLVDLTGWPSEEWDDLAVRSPAGHPFQSVAWGELKAAQGWVISRLAVRGPQGWLAGAARQKRAIALTIDPLWDEAMTPLLAAAGFVPAPRPVQVSRTAMVVPVDPDPADQHRRLRKSTANLINRARRHGITVERLGPGVDDQALMDAWDLLAATARREGIVLRGRGYQIRQWRLLLAAGHADLWFAGRQGRRDVVAVTLHCGRLLHLFQAGSADDADLGETAANHLLQWEILRWAAGAGFAEYDLGGVDTPRAPGIPGGPEHPLWNLYLFKRGFGARPRLFVPAHEAGMGGPLRWLWRFVRRRR